MSHSVEMSRQEEVTTQFIPIYSDDEDDDGVQRPKYLDNVRYTEVLYSPIEVTLVLMIDMDNTHPHLFDSELQFVDFAIRKILIDDYFRVWDVEVESHYISNVHKIAVMGRMFECDYNGIFSVGVEVNAFETDVLGLKEEMKVSLQTAMNTGKFNRALRDAMKIQLKSIQDHPGEKVESYQLLGMNVYNNEFKTVIFETQPPPLITNGEAYLDFLRKDEDVPPSSITTTNHIFSPPYVALTVFALTIIGLFVSYGCFMSHACRRVRRGKSHNSPDDDDVEIVLGGDGNSEKHEEPDRVIKDIVDMDDEDSKSSPNHYHQTETISF